MASLMSKPRGEEKLQTGVSDQRGLERVNTPLQIDENGQQIEVLEGSGTSVACHVTITVHKKDCAMFEKISIENAISSSSKRTGVYDLTFSKNFLAKTAKSDESDAAEEYLFMEVFRDSQAQTFHSQTAHSQNWKTKVEPMMAKARTWIQFDQVVFPADDKMWA